MRNLLVFAVVSMAPLVGAAGAAAEPADKLVPAGQAGPLSEWAGQPWWQALAYCSATQTRQVDWMKSVDNPEGVAFFRERSMNYLMAAGKRVQADRSLSYSQALDVASPKAKSYAFALAAKNHGNDLAIYKGMNDSCSAIKAAADQH